MSYGSGELKALVNERNESVVMDPTRKLMNAIAKRIRMPCLRMKSRRLRGNASEDLRMTRKMKGIRSGLSLDMLPLRTTSSSLVVWIVLLNAWLIYAHISLIRQRIIPGESGDVCRKL